MTSDDDITFYIETTGTARRRYTGARSSCLWPSVWLFLCSTTPLNTPVISMDIEIVGKVRYENVVVDLMCQQPAMFLDHMGVEEGSVIRISAVKGCKWRLTFPVPLRPGERKMRPEIKQVVHPVKSQVMPVGQSGRRIIMDSEDEEEEEESEESDDDEYTGDEDSHYEEEEASEEDGEENTYHGTETTLPDQLVDGYYHCDYKGCNAKVKTWSNMYRHFKRSHGQDAYHCPHPGCGEKFRFAQIYSRHILSVHEGKVLPRLSRKTPSRPRPASSSSPKYTCSVCKTQLATSSTLRRHFESKHSDKRHFYKCFFCRDVPGAKEFNRRDSLKLHIRSVHGVVDPAEVDEAFEYALRTVEYRERE